MATDRGLASVPRGLDRGLTTYLQSIDATLRRLSGLVRGSGESRAVRASEAHAAFGGTGGGSLSSGVDVGAIASQVLRDGSVTERKLVDGAVTSAKLRENSVTAQAIAPGEVIENALREGCVTSGKLADKAVTTDKLAAGSVTTDKLEQGAVTADKLAPEVLPPANLFVGGTATHGETVTIQGEWKTPPIVFLTKFEAMVEESTEEDAEGNTTHRAAVRAGVANLREASLGVWQFDAEGNFTWVALCLL